jgi:Ca2+ transporting ATPase
MVTGDNVTTARAIAKKCGILDEARGDLVMEGPDFRKQVLDDKGNIKQDVMDTCVPLAVCSRCSSLY